MAGSIRSFVPGPLSSSHSDGEGGSLLPRVGWCPGMTPLRGSIKARKSALASLCCGIKDLPIVSIRVFRPQCMSLSEASLCPDLTLSPFLFGDQPDPDPELQDFHKGGYKRSACPSVRVCAGQGVGTIRNLATEKTGSLMLKGTRVE